VTEAELPGTTSLVLGLSFAIAVVFGALAQQTRFCTMGAVADLAAMGDWTRLRLWGVALGTAIVGFNLMVALGWIAAANSIYAGPRVMWLSAVCGGLMFGIGMVLGGGCASRNLLRAGTGNLKAVVVLLVVALAGFATLKGITAVLRVNSVDTVFLALEGGQDLPSLLARATGMSVAGLAGAVGTAIGGAILVAALYPRRDRSAELVLGGAGLGLLVVAAWWVSGVLGYTAEHPQTLEATFLATNSRRMESLTFVSAVSYAADYLLFFSDASKVLTIAIVSAAGMIVGAALHALLTGSLRWEGFAGAADLRNHLVGGVLMGVGGVTALGCTIGQGLSGVSTLSITSVIALASILAGGFATVRYQAWQIGREPDETAPRRPA